MSAASNYLELQLLNHSLGTATFTRPTAVWVALFTGDPTESGAFTSEIVATSTAYARQTATFASAVNGSASTSATITFPTATANWGTVSHIAIVDSATRGAGNVLFYGPVTTAKIIETGDTFQITGGNLTVSLD